jgi:hypothetical protein
MKLALFSPYGRLHKEGGLLYLVANYLARSGADVGVMRCDGAVSACGRDRSGSVVRTPFQCARCANEQHALALWAGARVRDISADTAAEDVVKTAQWLRSVPTPDLSRVEFRGVNLWSVCRAEFGSRWEDVDISRLSAPQEYDLRSLFSSYVRVCVASERFLGLFKPTLCFATSLNDPLTYGFLAQAKLAGLETVVFSYEPDEEVVAVQSLNGESSDGQSPDGQRRYTTSLVLEGVASMRPDPRTWGPEVTSVVHEVLTFLGYGPDRVL